MVIAFSAVPPTPTPITRRGAGIAAGEVDRLADEVDHGFAARPGEEVLIARHVLAAAALRHEADVQFVGPGRSPVWITPGVFVPVFFRSPEGVVHDRLAQVAIAVALLDTGVDRVDEVAAGDVQILAKRQVHDGGAGVLAEGQHPLAPRSPRFRGSRR